MLIKSGLGKDKQMCLHPLKRITFHYKAFFLFLFHLELSTKYFEYLSSTFKYCPMYLIQNLNSF